MDLLKVKQRKHTVSELGTHVSSPGFLQQTFRLFHMVSASTADAFSCLLLQNHEFGLQALALVLLESLPKAFASSLQVTSNVICLHFPLWDTLSKCYLKNFWL